MMNDWGWTWSKRACRRLEDHDERTTPIQSWGPKCFHRIPCCHLISHPPPEQQQLGNVVLVRILLYCTADFLLVLPHCRLVFIYLFISPQPGNFPWQLFFINEEQKILLSGGKCVTAKRYFNWWRECEPYTRWIKLNVSDWKVYSTKRGSYN